LDDAKPASVCDSSGAENRARLKQEFAAKEKAKKTPKTVGKAKKAA
jgi:hypothetical protein